MEAINALVVEWGAAGAALEGEAASAQTIADRILETHRRPTDDALVLVCRYLGLEGRAR